MKNRRIFNLKLMKWVVQIRAVGVLMALGGGMGCVSLGPRFTEMPQKAKGGLARVTFYRPYLFAGAAGSPYICIDDEALGEFVNGSYFHLELPPGKHKIETVNGLGEHRGLIELSLAKNGDYFLRFNMMGLPGSAEGSQVSASTAGAINPVAGPISGALLSQVSEESRAVFKEADPRVPQTVQNLGLLAVNEGFAKKELLQTKLYTLVPPKINKCLPKTKIP